MKHSTEDIQDKLVYASYLWGEGDSILQLDSKIPLFFHIHHNANQQENLNNNELIWKLGAHQNKGSFHILLYVLISYLQL